MPGQAVLGYTTRPPAFAGDRPQATRHDVRLRLLGLARHGEAHGRIDRRRQRDDHSGASLEATAAQDIAVETGPRRTQREESATGTSSGLSIADGLESVKIEADDLAQISVAVVQQRPRKISNTGRRTDRLVNQRGSDTGDQAVEEPHRSFARPMTVFDFSIADKRPATDAPTCQQVGRRPVHPGHRHDRTAIENLVGIDGQDPVVTREGHGAALLRTISIEGVFVPSARGVCGDLPGPVGRSRIQNDNLGADGQGLECLVEMGLGVFGDHDRRYWDV